MLDPLTALSVAGNVVQFVDFTTKLLSKSRKIYNSANGALVENMELEAVARNLMELSSRISEAFRSKADDVQLTWEDRNLQTLCENCGAVAEEILALLGKLKLHSKHGKWDSFRKALKTVGSENELDGLMRRLEMYRKQLDTLLLASLRYGCIMILLLVQSTYERCHSATTSARSSVPRISPKLKTSANTSSRNPKQATNGKPN